MNWNSLLPKAKQNKKQKTKNRVTQSCKIYFMDMN